MRASDTTCSFSRPSTPTATTSRLESGSPGRRSDGADTVIRGSAGLFLRSRPAPRAGQRVALRRQHDRSEQPAPDQHEPVARASRRAGVSASPQRAGAARHARELHDDGPEHPERVLASRPASKSSARSATHASYSVGYQFVRGRNLIISVNQNVPSCVAAGTNNGCRPESDVREQQPVFVGREIQLSRSACVVRAAAIPVGQLPRELHVVEVDEQRRRELFQLADRSVRSRQGLGTVRRRPAAPACGDRVGEYVDGCRAIALADC